MTCTTHLTEELRTRGYRITPQRREILALLHETPGHFSPAVILEHVRKTIPGVTETTIYRTLEFLAENDMVCSSLQSDGHLVYEDAAHSRHHHIICRKCGKQVQVEHEALLGLYQDLKAATGFDIHSSHLTFFGLCPTCARSEETWRRQPHSNSSETHKKA